MKCFRSFGYSSNFQTFNLPWSNRIGDYIRVYNSINHFSCHVKALGLKILRSSRLDAFCKKGVLRNSQNSQENTCARVSFSVKLQASSCDFIKKETLAQVCEFYKISENTFCCRTPSVAASELHADIYFFNELSTI